VDSNRDCITISVTDKPTPVVVDVPECKDKDAAGNEFDNDGDGLPNALDPGCHISNDPTKPYDPTDDSELNPPTVGTTQCNDYDASGNPVDNDLDGYANINDPGCHTNNDPTKPYDPTDNSELNPPTGSVGTPGVGTVVIPPYDDTFTFTVNPGKVRKDTSAKMTWNVGSRTSCSISATNGQAVTITSANKSATLDTNTISSQTSFTLTCTDVGHEAVKKIDVTVVPIFVEI
jgi:hypothetical protein